MARGNLKPKDFQIVQRNYVYLKENLDAQHIVDHLFQHDVISWEEKEKIGCKESKRERNEIMLAALLHAGPGEAFSHFLQSLEPCYKHVRDTLEQYGKTLVKVEVKGNEVLQPKEEEGEPFVKMEVEEDEIFQLKVELAQTKETLRVTTEYNVKLQNQCGQAYQELKTKDDEIEKLIKQNAQANEDLEFQKDKNANEAIKMKNKEINKLIKLDDIKQCVEIAITGRRLDDKGKAAFWETEQPRLKRKGCAVPPKLAMALSGSVYLLSEYEEWNTRQLRGADLETAFIEFLNDIGLRIPEWVLFKEEFVNYQNNL